MCVKSESTWSEEHRNHLEYKYSPNVWGKPPMTNARLNSVDRHMEQNDTQSESKLIILLLFTSFFKFLLHNYCVLYIYINKGRHPDGLLFFLLIV